MSLEQTFSSKLTIENDGATSLSSSSAPGSLVLNHHQQSGETRNSCGQLNTQSSSGSPVRTSRHSSFGRSDEPKQSNYLASSSVHSARSAPPPSVPSREKSLKKTSTDLSFPEGTVLTTSNNSCEHGNTNAGSTTGTKRLLGNWCRTKNRTKDFIRRWKTLPENHPDFDHLESNSSHRSSPTNSVISVNSTGSGHHEGGYHGLSKVVAKHVGMNKRDGANDLTSGGTSCSTSTMGSRGPHGRPPLGGNQEGSKTGWSVHVWGKLVIYKVFLLLIEPCRRSLLSYVSQSVSSIAVS